MDWEVLISALGGGGVGGWVASWLGASPSRRRARAQVRDAVLKLLNEQPRWFSLFEAPRDFDRDAWDDAARAVQVECLAARVPRPITDGVLRSTRMVGNLARWKNNTMSIDELEMLQEWHQGHVELITDFLWRPWLTGVTYRRRLRGLEAAYRRLKAMTKERAAEEVAAEIAAGEGRAASP